MAQISVDILRMTRRRNHPCRSCHFRTGHLRSKVMTIEVIRDCLHLTRPQGPWTSRRNSSRKLIWGRIMSTSLATPSFAVVAGSKIREISPSTSRLDFYWWFLQLCSLHSRVHGYGTTSHLRSLSYSPMFSTFVFLLLCTPLSSILASCPGTYTLCLLRIPLMTHCRSVHQ